MLFCLCMLNHFWSLLPFYIFWKQEVWSRDIDQKWSEKLDCKYFQPEFFLTWLSCKRNIDLFQENHFHTTRFVLFSGSNTRFNSKKLNWEVKISKLFHRKYLLLATWLISSAKYEVVIMCDMCCRNFNRERGCKRAQNLIHDKARFSYENIIQVA